jgi:O-antigen ligase
LWVISGWLESKIEVMLSVASEKSLAKFLSIGAAAVTVFVLTGSVSDPVNATKFFLFGGVAFASFAIFLTSGWSVLREQKLILGVFVLFLLASINAIVNSDSPLQQNIYGTYGRNTGFLTYLFLSLIFLSTTILREKKSFNLLISALIFSLVVNVIYCLYVIVFGDFIGWNNPYGNILGTFGNPNFISAYLGFSTTATIAYALTKKVSLKIKVLTAVTSLVAVYEIVDSKAIQGLVVFAAGLAVIGFYLVRSKFNSVLALSIYTISIFSVGLTALFGALQIGPFTQYIYKTSVSLRGEYWQAGINMARENLFTGVGFDSYGDWFRRSRDAQALILPGPNTVTNAAHNVPIDVLAFGGVPLLVPYLALIVVVAIAIIRHTIKNREYDGLFVALTTGWVGYQIQSIISINQIGLAIWGWLLGGAILAYTKSFKRQKNGSEPQSKLQKKRKSKEQIFSPQLIGGIGMIIGLIISYPPVSGDSKFQGALKSGQIAAVETALTSSYLTPTDTIRLLSAIQILEQNSAFDVAYKYAKLAVEFNPENFDAWRIMNLIQNSTPEEKALAKKKMIELDPLNEEWKKLS